MTKNQITKKDGLKITYFQGHVIETMIDHQTQMFYCTVNGKTLDCEQQGSEDNAIWYAKDGIVNYPHCVR
jgi:hypothetical protein